MIISRRKYEHDLKEAYEKGRYEAENRFYQERANERLYDLVDRLKDRVRKLEGKADPAANVPVYPFED